MKYIELEVKEYTVKGHKYHRLNLPSILTSILELQKGDVFLLKDYEVLKKSPKKPCDNTNNSS